MSHIDAQLEALRRNLAALEEQKRVEVEKELEEKMFPLKTLEGIFYEKKKLFTREKNRNALDYCIKCEAGHVRTCVHNIPNVYSQNNLQPMPQHLKPEKDMINILDPIINVLKNIQDRLEALEKRE